LKTDFEKLAIEENLIQKYGNQDWSSSLVWDKFVGVNFETNCKDSNAKIAAAKISLLKEMLEMNYLKRISLGKVVERLQELEELEQEAAQQHTAQSQQEEQYDDVAD